MLRIAARRGWFYLGALAPIIETVDGNVSGSGDEHLEPTVSVVFAIFSGNGMVVVRGVYFCVVMTRTDGGDEDKGVDIGEFLEIPKE